jgi:hypothetical protein
MERVLWRKKGPIRALLLKGGRKGCRKWILFRQNRNVSQDSREWNIKLITVEQLANVVSYSWLIFLVFFKPNVCHIPGSSFGRFISKFSSTQLWGKKSPNKKARIYYH